MQQFNEYLDRKQDELVQFCEDRKKGASKIATEAKSKGAGPAQLTAWHFSAKLPEYDECIKAIKMKKPASYFQQQEIKLIHQLSGIRNQRNFQEIMGRAEVWGEIFIKVYSN
jgi:hypothetical protein